MKWVATWIKGRAMTGACELVLVKEWREDVYVLLCLEGHGSHSKDFAELRQRGIPVTTDNVVEFNAEELAILEPILRETPPPLRHQLRNNVLSLKRSFDGQLVPADEFRRQAGSVATGLLGSPSPAASPERTTASPAASPASGSSPRPSSSPSRGLGERLRQRLRTSASASASAAFEKAEESSSARSTSFAERLKKRAAESGTGDAATPSAPTS